MTDDTDHDAELERITLRIRTLVDEHFTRGDERFYLSSLGSLLGDDRKELEKRSGRKLGDYVEHMMDYETGRAGQHQNILYIVRPESFGPATVHARSKPLRFVREIWIAFATPLAKDERRFFDPASRTVLPAPPGEGIDVREIDPQFITNGELDAGQIAENIRKWTESQGLDLALFVASRAREKNDGSSLLHHVLEALSGDQLKRTSLPLDVIKTLSERRGG